MKTHSLRAHLIDFSVPRSARPLVPTPARDVEAEIAAARAEGFRAGSAEALANSEAECSARIADIEIAAEAMLAESRVAWVETTAALATENIIDAFSVVEQSLADATARVLTEIATLAARPIAVQEAARSIGDLLRDRNVTRFEISGPPDLVDALESRLTGLSIDARRVEGTTELRVRLDQTILQSRLGDWRRSLVEAVDAIT